MSYRLRAELLLGILRTGHEEVAVYGDGEVVGVTESEEMLVATIREPEAVLGDPQDMRVVHLECTRQRPRLGPRDRWLFTGVRGISFFYIYERA